MRKTFILTALMMSFVNVIPSYTYALGPNTVDSAAIIDGQVKTADIDALAVTTNNIADGAITDAKITGPISASKLEKPANVTVVATSGGDFTSISAALASLPTPNTTPVVIKVMPGTYTESILMKSYVNLQGAGRDITTIEGDITVDYGITAVTISGFKISGGYIDVNGWQTPDQKITITGNYLTGSTGAALQIWYCSPYFTVSDNIITASQTGISMGACRANIRNNRITGNSGRGISNSGDSNGFSSDAVIADNVISNNGSDGIYNSGNSKVLIRDNVISNNGNSGINNYNASPMITGNNIMSNGDSGIYNNAASPTIMGNTITSNGTASGDTAGVAANNSTVMIKDNIIDGNEYGITGDDPSRLTIKNNIIKNNLLNGVSNAWSLPSPTSSQVIGNIIKGNGGDDPTIYDLCLGNAHISHNVYDKRCGASGFWGNFNEKSGS